MIEDNERCEYWNKCNQYDKYTPRCNLHGKIVDYCYLYKNIKKGEEDKLEVENKNQYRINELNKLNKLFLKKQESSKPIGKKELFGKKIILWF